MAMTVKARLAKLQKAIKPVQLDFSGILPDFPKPAALEAESPHRNGDATVPFEALVRRTFFRVVREYGRDSAYPLTAYSLERQYSERLTEPQVRNYVTKGHSGLLL